MITRTGAAVLVLVWGVALAGCGADNSLQNAPSKSPDVFTVLVNVHPPTSLRTEQTWDYWTTPAQATFQTTLASSAEEGAPYEAFIGKTTAGGFRIVAYATLAETTWTVGQNGLKTHLPFGTETHCLKVTLEDGIGGRNVPGYINIPGAGVTLTINGTEKAIELQPVQGPRGIRYEANASIPLGVYDLKIRVSPPNLYRSTTARDRWTEEITAELPDYDLSFGSGNARVETSGMRVTVRAGTPRVYGKPYGAFGTGLLPLKLTGDETVNFSVRLEDMASPAEGVGQRITHSRVEVTVSNGEPGRTVRRILYPMYGAQGFFYAANLALPGGVDIEKLLETGSAGSDPNSHCPR